MSVIPTLLNYYLLCHRKAWFFGNGIQMGPTFDLIASDRCPPLLKKSICRNCSYFDLCWSGEDTGEDETASRNL